MSIKLIQLQDISVQYQGAAVLSKISFDIESGDYIGIVGPNGSGKTTLIKSILGLVPFEGNIIFDGASLSEFKTRKHIGYLPQKISFFDPWFPATAREIVASGVYCCKRFPKCLSRDDYAAAEKAMDILGVKDLQHRPIGRLSGGQQQRVLLARALVHRPKLLILDEPTVALDPQSREVFYSTIEKLNKEEGATILLVSHDVGSAGHYVSKLLYLDKQVVFYGTLEEFCRSSVMAGYFGASQHLICHRH